MKKTTKISLITVTLVICLVILSYIGTFHQKNYIADEVSNGPKQIAITFDDGPGENTQMLLDGLKERNIKVSFFLLGNRAEKNPDAVKQMAEDGHLIGNHSYSHLNLFRSTYKEVNEQIEKTNDIIEGITGDRPKFIRPPYGAYSPITLERIDEIAVLWSMTPKDWKHTNDEDYICSYIVEHAKDGQIVLLHDTKPATVPAVLRAIDILQDEGFEFVRADSLLCRGGKKLSAGLGYRFCANNGIAYWF